MLFVVLASLAVAPGSAYAQDSTSSGIEVQESAAEPVFSNETREIRFLLRARADERIRSAMLLYYVGDTVVQNTGTPLFQPGASIVARYTWRVAGVLLPGTEVRYQWQIETDGGRKLTSPMQTVAYTDSRFVWRELQGDQVTIYTHGTDAQAGAALLDEARKSQTKLRSEYGLTFEKPVRVYAYTREQDYLSAIASSARQVDRSMTIGTDRILVLAPGAGSGMANTLTSFRQELAALVFAQKTDNPYGPPPQWLSQGFILYAAGEPISENNYKALGQYAQNNRLLPLRSLNGNFPTDGQERSLALAESATAVKFMYEAYGPEKVRAVLEAFKAGSTPEDAIKKGLGVTLEQFETRWKNALKSGAASKGASRVPEVGDGGLVDRLFGPAIQYWRGVFGPNARWVAIGGGAFVVLGLFAVIAGTIIGTVRRARAEVDE